MAKKQKKETKYPETVKITFHPQFSAATQKTIFLRELVTELVGNTTKKSYKPLIEGLPEIFTIRKDEVVTVTADQFIALDKHGFIDTPEALRKKRNSFNFGGT